MAGEEWRPDKQMIVNQQRNSIAPAAVTPPWRPRPVAPQTSVPLPPAIYVKWRNFGQFSMTYGEVFATKLLHINSLRIRPIVPRSYADVHNFLNSKGVTCNFLSRGALCVHHGKSPHHLRAPQLAKTSKSQPVAGASWEAFRGKDRSLAATKMAATSSRHTKPLAISVTYQRAIVGDDGHLSA